MADNLIEVRTLNEPLTFSRIEDFESWLNKEVSFWEWLQEEARREANLYPVHRAMSSTFTEARNLIQIYKREEAANKPSVARQLGDKLSQLYSVHLLPSSSAKAEFVQKIRATDSRIAAYALAGLLKRPLQLDQMDTNIVRGLTLAAIFDTGVTSDTAEAHHVALTRAEEKWLAFDANAKKEHAAGRLATESLQKEIMEWRDVQQKRYTDIADEASRRFNTIADEGVASFSEIQKTYNEQLGLQAPVTYWEKRARSYLINAVVFSVAALAMKSLPPGGGKFIGRCMVTLAPSIGSPAHPAPADRTRACAAQRFHQVGSVPEPARQLPPFHVFSM
jgi:hypothetical protein